MNPTKALTLATLLAVGTILATAMQAGPSTDSFNPQPEPAGSNPHPGSPGAFLLDPFYP
jgi:hypothetical protein